ncbi:MAG: DNA recombination protein RmuC [Akkermansia sp.]
MIIFLSITSVVLLVTAIVLLMAWLRTRESGIRLESDLSSARLRDEQSRSLLDQAKSAMRESFAEVSSEVIKNSSEQFLTLAQTRLTTAQEKATHELDTRKQAIESLIKPVNESLKQMQTTLGTMEKDRQFTYGSLQQQIKFITESNISLRKETSRLSQALHSNSARGRWGELQLKRVVEMAGMTEHCDFTLQESRSDTQQAIRPDMVVNLPGNRCVIVDAKAPMNAYLEGMEQSDPEQRKLYLAKHAAQVRTHLQQLGAKSYFAQFDNTPEFVVMFLPGESFFQAALESDPSLIEFGVEHKVILATPTTLIALLRAVAYGWRHEQLADNAKAISLAGADLYDSCVILSDHFNSVGQSLNQAVTRFNKTVGSYERRMLPKAKRLKELGISGKKEMPESPPLIDTLAHTELTTI